MTRIGILGHRFIEWGGGLDFLRMVCASLHATGEPLQLHLLLPTRGPRAAALALAHQAQGLLLQALGRGSMAAFAPAHDIVLDAVADTGGEVQIHTIDAGDAALLRAAARLALDVVLPAFDPLPPGATLPWVGYVYDFQHLHLPQLFTPEDRAKRDRNFARLLDRADVVIANARAVADDARRFRPQSQARIVALPFSAAPAPAWLDIDVGAVCARHGLQQPYFIVCNQFWVHKDHGTAFRAFAQVAAAHPDVHLVCTGATSDHRSPAHFETLMQFVAAHGLQPRVHVLGLIPKREQIALVRAALALVQPTLSEGGPGGGAVYDAVSLGVPALVSDIAVNREIDEPEVRFFRAGDADDLARGMHAALQAGSVPAPSSDDLLRRGRQRRAQCGQALLQAIAMARQRR
ncbi:MAG: glycosyltransferase family 1 protein [Rubrivivax sp.]